MPTATDVAKLFLFWANQEGDLITNLKMQKLLYYTQAWHLVNFKRPLFDDVIKAWDLGPVILTAYHHFKTCGNSPISHAETGSERDPFSKKQLEYLEAVYDAFVKYTAHELVNMTHNEDPWKKATKTKDKIITHESMKKYYSSLLDS